MNWIPHLRGKTVLVTGASGFLGSTLLATLEGKDTRIVGIDLNTPISPIPNLEFYAGACEDVIQDVVRASRPDVIFHLAGPASVAASLKQPLEDFDGLLPGVAALGDVLLRENLRPTVAFFSSAAVYGEPSKLPIHESAKIAPLSPYGVHKATAETMLSHYGVLGDFPVASLRIFSAYGAGLRRQLFWDLGIRAIHSKLRGATTVQVFGTGRETRDFIHAQDVASAACFVAATKLPNGLSVFNVASGFETRIADAAQTLVKAIDPTLELEFTQEARHGDPSRWVADISKLKATGFNPQRNFSMEISSLAHWIFANYSL